MEKTITDYQNRIRSSYDEKFAKNAIQFVDFIKLPSLFFKEISVTGLEQITNPEGKQLIYISNHVSLADFLVQAYVFSKNKIKMPKIVAGENLYHFPFNILWKKFGAMAVDRSQKSRAYWKTYDLEMMNYLNSGEHFLIYPEGGRSYENDGVKDFKKGSFGQITRAIESGQDLWMVPTFIKYDKRVEEKFLGKIKSAKEKRDACLLQGERLKAKLYDKAYFGWDVFAYFCRPFDCKKGNVNLAFGEPFSARDFLAGVLEQKKFGLMDKVRSELIELGRKI
jgi:1-acyl-sn-glycerol-3-phosphate acyltransferase